MFETSTHVTISRLKHKRQVVALLAAALGLFNSHVSAQTVTPETTCAAGEYLRDGIFCVPCEPGKYCFLFELVMALF